MKMKKSESVMALVRVFETTEFMEDAGLISVNLTTKHITVTTELFNKLFPAKDWYINDRFDYRSKCQDAYGFWFYCEERLGNDKQADKEMDPAADVNEVEIDNPPYEEKENYKKALDELMTDKGGENG